MGVWQESVPGAPRNPYGTSSCYEEASFCPSYKATRLSFLLVLELTSQPANFHPQRARSQYADVTEYWGVDCGIAGVAYSTRRCTPFFYELLTPHGCRRNSHVSAGRIRGGGLFRSVAWR
eukprot:2860884-Rhodomonas_salina.2